MKLGVIADSHGNVEGVRAAVRMLVKAGAEMILHLGDGVDDAHAVEQSEGVTITCVSGNNDAHSEVAEYSFELKGKVILALHGDRQDMNRYHGEEMRAKSIEKLLARAEAHGAQIILFGHTHHAVDFVHSGVRFINPGALDLGSPEKTCCLIDFNTDEPTVEFISV